jgi:hypothetical protein
MSDNPMIPLCCAVVLALVAAGSFGLSTSERVLAGVMACVALVAALLAMRGKAR